MAKTKKPKPDDLRAAVAKRVPSPPPERTRPTPVSELFDNRTTRRAYGSGQTHTIPIIRCSEELADGIAAYGNERGLTPSETVRDLIRLGLDSTKDSST